MSNSSSEDPRSSPIPLNKCKAGVECKDSNGSIQICKSGEHCVKENVNCVLIIVPSSKMSNCKDTIVVRIIIQLYGCCLDKCGSVGGSGCCLWPGCVSCGFDVEGNPNQQNIYLAFLNDPDNMAKFMVASANTVVI